ncbi:MAG: YdcF family protein [Oscillospiraceae bacterium]|nr:YdcF family protein [Oscillospiraceae bacterium]
MKNVQILWDYMHLNQPLEQADVIVGFGCYDEDIPRRCAELYHAGFAPCVAFSGGLGRNTSDLWTKSEAERFAAIAMACGVPENRIILENKSTNSAENLLFTPKVLAEQGVRAKKIIAVHKPYMERRLWSAMQVYWPDVEAIYTSPQVTLEEHIRHAEAAGMNRKGVIETIVGDIQRMELYAKKGYQVPVEIPETVREAFRSLVEQGYTGQLAK